MSIELNAIAAMCDLNKGIGKNNDLPWSLPDDFKYFLRFIKPPSEKVNALIVGRLTWYSMDELEEFKSNIIVIVSTKFKRNVQLFDYKSYDPNRILFTETFQEAVDLIIDNYLPIVNQMIAIGGTNIYSEAIKSPYFSRFYLTRIFKHFDCDAFLETEDFRTNNLKKLGNHELLKESLLYQCQYNTIKTSNDGIDYVFEAYEKN